MTTNGGLVVRGLGKSIVACVAATAIVIGLGGPAQAAERPNPTDKVLNALEVAPELGMVSQLIMKGDGALVAALPGGGTAEISTEGDGAVALTSPGLPSISLSLPEGVDTADAVVTQDGTVVYASNTTIGADVAVQALARSVSIQTVIPDKRSAHAFTYQVGEGITPRLRADGGVDLLMELNGAAITIGQIAKPWAVDADGLPVATRYAVSGSDVTQIVTTTDSTAYPVVADPLLTYGFGVYMNMRGYQYNAIAAVLVGVAVGVSTAACLGAKLPAAWAKAVGVACTVIGVSSGITALLSGIRSAWNMPLETNGCYQMRLLNAASNPSPGGLTKVAVSQCA